MSAYTVKRTFKIGQRVLAPFGYPATKVALGVVTSVSDVTDTVYVQSEPCGAHWGCQSKEVSAHGDANGWTDKEYRVARELAYCRERAAEVEAERNAKYPDAPFSAYEYAAGSPF